MPVFSRFLRYFMSVAQHGSIRKASDELHIAASAIDRQILQGERTLDTLLFERLPTGLRLTAAGELLLTACNRWSRDMNTVRTQIDPAAAEPHFRKLTETPSVLSRARGFYWLGQARAQAGDMTSAKANWRQAAEAPETFYGQMAVAKLAGAGNTLLAPTEVPEALVTALNQWRTASAGNEHAATAIDHNQPAG